MTDQHLQSLRRAAQANPADEDARKAYEAARQRTCDHSEIFWYPATNERGWRCTCGFKPGEPPGYDPQRDVDDLEGKVRGLLLDLVDGVGFLGNMNSDAGEGMIAGCVARRRQAGAYDQASILIDLLKAYGGSQHWKRVGDGVRSGNDPRSRCQGGNLATCFTGNGVNTCSEEGCACAAQRGLFA